MFYLPYVSHSFLRPNTITTLQISILKFQSKYHTKSLHKKLIQPNKISPYNNKLVIVSFENKNNGLIVTIIT